VANNLQLPAVINVDHGGRDTLELIPHPKSLPAAENS